MISIHSLVLIVLLLLAMDGDHQGIELSEADKQSINARKAFTSADFTLYFALLNEYGKKKLAEGFDLLQCLPALSP